MAREFFKNLSYENSPKSDVPYLINGSHWTLAFLKCLGIRDYESGKFQHLAWSPDLYIHLNLGQI